MSMLSGEVTRRLRNTSLEVDHSTRLDILERACTKMMTSGHRENFIRQSVVKGIGAFREKLERSQLDTDNPGFQHLYQKAGWRNNERSKEKAMKQSTVQR